MGHYFLDIQYLQLHAILHGPARRGFLQALDLLQSCYNLHTYIEHTDIHVVLCRVIFKSIVYTFLGILPYIYIIQLQYFSKLDYAGIALLTVGSFVPWIYYGFYCQVSRNIILSIIWQDKNSRLN